MEELYYLCFSVNKLPDLTLTKYSVFDGSGVDNIMDKHGVFLRQLHRLGYTAGVYFHLLYYYNPDKRIPKGHHLSIIFYATSSDCRKLEGIREFLTTSVLSTYYDFFCYEIAKEFKVENERLSDGSEIAVLRMKTISGYENRYALGKTREIDVEIARQNINKGLKKHIVGEIASDSNVMLSFDRMPISSNGRIIAYRDYFMAESIELLDKFDIESENDPYKAIVTTKKYKTNIYKISKEYANILRSSGINFEKNADAQYKVLFSENGEVINVITEKVLQEEMSDITEELSVFEYKDSSGNVKLYLKTINIIREKKKLSLDIAIYKKIRTQSGKIVAPEKTVFACETNLMTGGITNLSLYAVDADGKLTDAESLEKKFHYGAFLTKKDYTLPAQNRLNTDGAGEVNLYSIMEWEPCETGRLYNVLKLMEGYDRSAVLRIDIFPVEHTQAIRQRLPYTETRRRISDRVQGKDDNSENIVKSWDKYLNNLMKFPQFLANVVAFADSADIAVMLADSVAAEAVESGTYLIETISSENGFSMYESDAKILHKEKENGNYVAPFLSLYTLEEIRPMFSLPILYPGESIECQKETDPTPFSKEVTVDKDTGELHEVISLGVSSMGYDVTFPVKLFKKHAFIAGVPGAGKTNTMLYLVTTLWRDTEQHVPFLVLEPAKQEYRALAMIDGMEALCVFSPGADTKFPLHINPFQFPVGLTLAEHIANLNAVFAGAFELIPPSPFLIDSCIEKVYLDKGWNINERNNGTKEYPTMQELYDSLKVAVEESGYEGESKANIRSVMEVRIGSLLRREIGNVYNVRKSSLEPEDWLKCPVIIELEALGEGPANFMSLLISTLIREVLKIRKTSDVKKVSESSFKREIEHIIFYEEAHNLIGPTTDDPVGGSVDPKISATKYLVKMLAEVRALGEGIVIADQLPTAMAPEVLKNTGLKLGHRITAQDDRNLLGSTMSASADQLEEQGTFGTGQALIFYENLLKPFKMRVCEWEKGVSQKKYDSPTNIELFERLKTNETYNILLARSAIIMQEKMKVEFDLFRNQAQTLKADISKKYAELEYISNNLNNLQEKLERLLDEKDRTETKKNIAETKLMYEKKQKEFSGAITRDLKKLCWGFSNQYYAYMTLSKNYYIYSDDMYMCTINNFLSLFGIMKSLHDVPELNSILLDETKNIMTDIEQYIDIKTFSSSALLVHHPAYNNAIYEMGDFINNLIDAETNKFYQKATDILSDEDDMEDGLTEFCEEFSQSFWHYYRIAEKYYTLTMELANNLQKDLENIYVIDTPEWNEANKRVTEYLLRANLLHKALAAYVVKLFKRFDGLQNINRTIFLTKTSELCAEFRKIVDYRDKNTDTILSSWNGYEEMWSGSNSIALLELGAKFDYFHQIRIEKLGKMNESNIDMKFFTELCKCYNGLFAMYYSMDVDSYEFQYVLVNHYRRFLEDVVDIGTIVYPVLFKYSTNNWKNCRKLMEKLAENDHIAYSVKEDWNKLSAKMTRAIKMLAQ